MAGAADVVKGLVSSALGDWRRHLRANEKGRLIECWQNVFVYLENHPDWKGVLGLDVFAQRVVKVRKPPLDRASIGPWSPEDDLELGLWLSALDGDERLVVRSKQTLIDGVSACAMRHKFHPVQDYLSQCRKGPKSIIDTWLTDFAGVKSTEYSSAVGRYFLMNLVARVFDPGCIMRSVPVLEGPQERGKSTLLNVLAQPWFSDSHFDLGSKDAFEVIQGVWLYEISEMEQFNKAEATRVKQFVSSREDNYRPPYERRAQRVPRQVGFGGTTNDRNYLKDWTGNTRYWPLRCEEVGSIRPDGLAEVRDALFAEALELWKGGARRHPTREESRELFEPEQAARRREHPWMERIAKWLDEPMAGGDQRDAVTVTQVLTDCLGFDAARMTEVHARDVGSIVTALGWDQVRETRRGYRPRFYTRPKDEDAPPAAAETETKDEEGPDVPF